MNEQRVSLRGIRPSTLALFEGTFGALVGVAIALVYLFQGTATYTAATDSLLQGLLFGLSVGFLAILVIPAIYFAIGWVIGYLQGLIVNAVLRTSGGVELDVAPDVMEEVPAGAAPANYNQSDVAFGERIERRPSDRK